MKIVYTKHALEDTFAKLKGFGWIISQRQIKNTIEKPKWRGKTHKNQETAMSLVDEKHILRVIFRREEGIIKVITFHIARRGKYGSTL